MHLLPTLASINPLNIFWPQIVDVKKKSDIYADSVTNESLSVQDLKLSSLQAFDRFSQIWNFDDFWKRASTCDACISLADALLSPNPDDEEVKKMCINVQEMLAQNLTYYRQSDLNSKWVDDFGWWGLMSLNAYKFLKKLGNDTLANEYFNLAKECWSYLVDQGYDETENAEPVAHGCRNNTSALHSEGVKNTVVNALLLLLSTRLYQSSAEVTMPAEDRASYLQKALQQWQWFSKWFEINDSYFRSFSDNAALVNERPLAPPDYQDMSHPDWSLGSKGWIWTADQALLIAGLMDLLEHKDKLDQNCVQDIGKVIQKLVKGIKEAMVGNDGILYEPPCQSSYYGYPEDYIGGRGILVRYIDQKKIKDQYEVDFSPNIANTVSALWSTRFEKINQFKPDFTSTDQILAYFKKFENLLGFSDDVTTWCFQSADQEFLDAISQAVGIDFLAAAYRSNL